MRRGLLPLTLLMALAVAGCWWGTLDTTARQTSETSPPTDRHQPAAEARPPASPALGKIAYVQGGDIWAKELPDGQPVRLTWDGNNSEPRWSPSGEWIAFRKSYVLPSPSTTPGTVWVMRADGSDPRPLEEGRWQASYAWAPLDDRLAYVTGGFGSLVVLDVATGQRRELTPATDGRTGAGVGRAVWSPDGAWLAYDEVRDIGHMEGPQPGPRVSSIWRVRADGSERTELLNAGTPSSYGYHVAGWTPDGQYVLYRTSPSWSASLMSDGMPLYAVPVSGGAPIQLASHLDPKTGASLFHADFLAVAPAATASRLALTFGAGREVWRNKRIGIVDVASGSVSLLTPDGVAAFSPSWSPDGQSLAFVAGAEYAGPTPAGGALFKQKLMELGRHIYVTNVNGEPHLRQLTDDPAYRDERPLWSADGAYILFVRMTAEDSVSLWLVPAGGGAPWRIVDELTPVPSWFGYYGYTNWAALFDWWRPNWSDGASP